MLLQDGHCLTDLPIKSLLVFEQMKQLAIIHLQQHTSDLASELGLLKVNQRVEALAKHLLLLLRECGRESGGSQSVAIGRGSRGRTVGRRTSRGRIFVTAATCARATSWGGSTWNRGRRARRRGLRTRTLSRNTAALASARLTWGTNALGGDASKALRDLAVRRHWSARKALRGLIRRLSRPARTRNHLLLGVGDALIGDETARTRIEHGCTRHPISRCTRHPRNAGLHAHVISLSKLGLELTLPDLFALGERYIDGLGADHAPIHLCNGFSSLVLGRETDETKPLGDIGLGIDF